MYEEVKVKKNLFAINKYENEKTKTQLSIELD